MRIFARVALASAIGGCATDTRGTQLVVDTPGVAGATCTLSAATIGLRTVVTPATVALLRERDNVAVHCAKECYYDGVGVIVSSPPGRAAADAAATNPYLSEIQVVMIPIAGCRPTGSPRP
jgi:hypothetical protein